MNISNQTEIELQKFNVRDVGQKEIYDSYMGILRISPNKIYGADVDDPTTLLNTLVDFHGAYGGIELNGKPNSKIEIRLSDSDGNLLPVYFIPKAFNTRVLLPGTDSEYRNLINLTTNIDSYVFVSHKMTNRSVLELKNPHYLEEQPNYKPSQLVIASGCANTNDDGAINTKEVLVYPIEAPNDDKFFNNKNNLSLFAANDSTPRHIQMENSLYQKSNDWYTENDLWYIQGNDNNHQVKVGGRVITSVNEKNESIPVLYTRDYVLGHYDGHSLAKGENATTKLKNWVKNNSDATDLQLDTSGRLTRLSWIRIDDLIWDYLDEVMKGAVRSVEGRYKGLGITTKYNNTSTTDQDQEEQSNRDNVFTNLFADRDTAETQGSYSLARTSSQSFLNDVAPILGQGHQAGLVSYHAMPLHRYWFHRCRQVVHNLSQWEKQHVVINPQWSQYGKNDFVQEFNELQSYTKSGLITPCCSASITPHHSLVKDFLLCDGKKVKDFINYPNISLKNDNFYEIKIPGSFAKAITDENTASHEFKLRESSDKLSVYSAITNTPDLFVFNEKSPRFIRGLNWKYNGESQEFTPQGETFNGTTRIDNNYNSKEKVKNGNETRQYVHSVNVLENEGNNQYTYPEGMNLDAHGNQGVDIIKNINSCRIYNSNVEYLTNVTPHYHKPFSNTAGGKGKNDLSKRVIQQFYRPSKQYVADTSLCLWEDQMYTSYSRCQQWVNYCLTKSKVFYDNYTPVPNLGCIIFNSQNYNPNNDERTTKGIPANYRGTIPTYEDNGWDISGFGYYDAKNQWHPLTKAHSIFPKFSKMETVYQNFKNDRKNTKDVVEAIKQHQASKLVRKQLAMKINESEARLPISYKGQAQFGLSSQLLHFWKKKRKWWQKVLAVLGCILVGVGLGAFFGVWGIVAGAVVGLGVGIWGIDQWLRGKWVAAYTTVYRYNIGSYEFATFGNAIQERTNYSWQCLTSLPYDDIEFLASGEIEKLNQTTYNTYKNATFEEPEKYYIAHNVTDLWNAYNNKEVSFDTANDIASKNPVENPEPSVNDITNDDEPTTVVRLQNSTNATFAKIAKKINHLTAPYPSHLTLLPIIRL